MPENKRQKTMVNGFRSVPVNITEGLEEAYTYLEDLSTKSGLYHLRTGCLELGYVFNFLNGGELVLIAGGPGVGKSTLAMSLAQHLATNSRQEPVRSDRRTIHLKFNPQLFRFKFSSRKKMKQTVNSMEGHKMPRYLMYS